METNYTEKKDLFKFEVADSTQQELKGIAQWGLISAIVGFISLGISIISQFMLMSNGRSDSFQLTMIVISTVISLVLNITLLQAANNIKNGIAANSQGQFNEGLTKLATYFRIVGIILITVVVLVIITVMFVSLYRK